MFQLEAAQSLAGVAGTATAITYTINLNEVTLAADTFKAPQGQLPAAAAAIYTTPASTSTLIKSMTLANATASPVTGIKFFKGGTAAANQITGTITIPANGTAIVTGEAVFVYDSAGTLVSIQLATNVTFTPNGSIAATNVQDAIVEVRDEAQPVDSDLSAIALLSTTAFGRAFLALADAAASRTYIGLGTVATLDTGTSGANVPTITIADGRYQASDADLAAIAALATTSFGRSFLTLADAAAGRSLLALGTVATLNTGTGAGDVPTITIGDGRYQPLDSDLSAIAASTTAAYGRSLLTMGNAAAVKASLAILDSDVDYTESTSQVVGTQSNFNINLNRWIFNVLNYIGASFVEDDGSGTVGTDIGAVMNTILGLITTAKGGKIVVPKALYRQVTAIVCNAQSVEIEGAGCGYNPDTGNFRDYLGTAFLWRGAAGQIQFDAYPVGGAGVGANLKGFRLSGLSFDGRDNRTVGGDVGSTRADKGLRLRSASGWHIEDLYVQDTVTAAVELGVLAPGTLAEAHDCTRGVLQRLGIRVTDGGGAGGTVLPGIGVLLGGSTNANTCFNQFDAWQISYVGANTGKPAIRLVNTDSNKFDTVSINNAGGGQTNWGIEVQGGASAAEASRANRFDNVSPGSAGMILCGTAGGKRPDETADAAFNFAAASGNNLIDENTENGEPYVYRGTGVVGPLPGASGGSTFAQQGFRCGGGVLKSAGAAAAIGVGPTVINTLTLPKWFFAPGTLLEFETFGLLINTATATNMVVRLRVGGTVISAITVATGATARVAPGTPAVIRGWLQCVTAGAAGTFMGNLFLDVRAAATATDASIAAATAPAAGTAVAASTVVSQACDIDFASGGATTTFTPLISKIHALN